MNNLAREIGGIENYRNHLWDAGTIFINALTHRLGPESTVLGNVDSDRHGFHLENMNNLALQCLKRISIPPQFWSRMGYWRYEKLSQSLVSCGNYFYICAKTSFRHSIDSSWCIECSWLAIHLENLNSPAVQCLKRQSSPSQFLYREVSPSPVHNSNEILYQRCVFFNW